MNDWLILPRRSVLPLRLRENTVAEPARGSPRTDYTFPERSICRTGEANCRLPDRATRGNGEVWRAAVPRTPRAGSAENRGFGSSTRAAQRENGDNPLPARRLQGVPTSSVALSDVATECAAAAFPIPLPGYDRVGDRPKGRISDRQLWLDGSRPRLLSSVWRGSPTRSRSSVTLHPRRQRVVDRGGRSVSRYGSAARGAFACG